MGMWVLMGPRTQSAKVLTLFTGHQFHHPWGNSWEKILWRWAALWLLMTQTSPKSWEDQGLPTTSATSPDGQRNSSLGVQSCCSESHHYLWVLRVALIFSFHSHLLSPPVMKGLKQVIRLSISMSYAYAVCQGSSWVQENPHFILVWRSHVVVLEGFPWLSTPRFIPTNAGGCTCSTRDWT